MTMSLPTLITFSLYLIGMLLIGTIAYRLTNNLSDYILGGRKLDPVRAINFLSALVSSSAGMPEGEADPPCP